MFWILLLSYYLSFTSLSSSSRCRHDIIWLCGMYHQMLSSHMFARGVMAITLLFSMVGHLPVIHQWSWSLVVFISVAGTVGCPGEFRSQWRPRSAVCQSIDWADQRHVWNSESWRSAYVCLLILAYHVTAVVLHCFISNEWYCWLNK